MKALTAWAITLERLTQLPLLAMPMSSSTTISIGSRISSRRRPSGIRCSGGYKDMGANVRQDNHGG